MRIRLSTERIILRSIRPADTEAIFSYRALESVARYQYWEPFTRKKAAEFVAENSCTNLDKRGEWIGLAIIRHADFQLIGDCALNIGGNQVELGCNLSPAYQHQGFAREALDLLVGYCFESVADVDTVVGIVDSQNGASIRLMQSLGMVRDADFEEHLICKGLPSIEHRYVRRKA